MKRASCFCQKETSRFQMRKDAGRPLEAVLSLEKH